MDSFFTPISELKKTFNSSLRRSSLRRLPSSADCGTPFRRASSSQLAVVQKTPATAQSWPESCFDDEEGLEWLKKKTRKRKSAFNLDDENPAKKEPIPVTFANKFDPESVDELAVNPTKVREVREWLAEHAGTHLAPKTLLLTGPCGSGKTTTVKLLCRDLKYDCAEFEPTHDLTGEDSRPGDSEGYGTSSSAAEVDAFVKFLHYAELGGHGRTKVVILEQLPSAFYRDPGLLKEILLGRARETRCVLVFIMSSVEKSWNLSPARIFPMQLANELQTTEIKFNSIAVTHMRLALRNLFDGLRISVCKNDIDSITLSADGDIRSAVNTIRFSIIGRTFARVLTTSMNHLTAFHYVGKVIYAKRADTGLSQRQKVERRLTAKAWRRPQPPKEDLNYLVDANMFDRGRLADYVFEHEPNFAPSLSSLRRVFSNLCDADAVVNQVDYNVSHRMTTYFSEIAIRSTVYNNYNPDPPKKREFYQFGKPQNREVRQSADALHATAVRLFPLFRSADMFTIVLPMLPSLNVYLGREEKRLIDSLSLKSFVNKKTWGGMNIRVNQRPGWKSNNAGGCSLITPGRRMAFVPIGRFGETVISSEAFTFEDSSEDEFDDTVFE